jgi:hypothetical protein
VSGSPSQTGRELEGGPERSRPIHIVEAAWRFPRPERNGAQAKNLGWEPAYVMAGMYGESRELPRLRFAPVENRVLAVFGINSTD